MAGRYSIAVWIEMRICLYRTAHREQVSSIHEDYTNNTERAINGLLAASHSYRQQMTAQHHCLTVDVYRWCDI